jgi:hypothetical protein
MAQQPPSDARPIFRRLAAFMAILLFLLAAAFALFGEPLGSDARRIGVFASLFVGSVMAAIASTGTWPRKRS